MVKTGKLLRSLIRAGTRTAKLFADATLAATPKPKRKRSAKSSAKTSARRRTPGAPRNAAPAATKVARSGARRAAASPTVSARPGGIDLAAVLSPASVRVPAPAVAPGKWLSSHVVDIAGRRMSYWLYLPNNLPARVASRGMPLVVMLHGCYQSATQFAQGTRMNLWAEKKGYAVLYPQQSVSSHPHRCWKWYDRATQNGGGDAATIVSIVNKVLAQYSIDRSRIYVAGISAGAGMANILALNHPELFAAVGLHSGPVFGAGHNALSALGVMKNGAAGMRADIAAHDILRRDPHFPGMPAILIQGEGDQAVRPINQLQLSHQSQLLNRLSGLPTTTHKLKGRKRNAYRQHDFYSGSKPVLRVVQIETLDHAWSGGDPELAFNHHAGPDASRMMLEFFSRHRRG